MATWVSSKDPEDIKDYWIDWGSERLVENEILLTSEWVVATNIEGGLIIDSSEFTPEGMSIVWLSGGTVGEYSLINAVTTNGGRTYEQTMKLKVKEH